MTNDSEKNTIQDRSKAEFKKKARNSYKTQFNRENYSRLSVWIAPERKEIYKNDATFRGFKDMSPYVRYLLEKDRQEILMEKLKRQEEVMRIAGIKPEDNLTDSTLTPEELAELLGYHTENDK